MAQPGAEEDPAARSFHMIWPRTSSVIPSSRRSLWGVAHHRKPRKASRDVKPAPDTCTLRRQSVWLRRCSSPLSLSSHSPQLFQSDSGHAEHHWGVANLFILHLLLIFTTQQEHALAAYGSVVLQAFHKVEGALANETLLTERF